MTDEIGKCDDVNMRNSTANILGITQPVPGQLADMATAQEQQPQGVVASPMESVVSMTHRLLSLRYLPSGTLASLSESEIKILCQMVRVGYLLQRITIVTVIILITAIIVTYGTFRPGR